jgi:hypothetical protein
VAEVRVTRPCRLCAAESDCAPFLRELRQFVAAQVDRRRTVPLPDVVVDCVLYTARHSAYPRA